MDKTELRKMIREEIKREFNQVLPQLIRESIGNVLAKEMNRARPAGRRTNRRAPSNTGKTFKPADRMKLTELMGYGDMQPGASKASPELLKIAGVPMEAGLEAKELSMGQAHLRDYTAESAEYVESTIEDESQFVGGVIDGGGSVPMELVAALGNNAKKTLDATNRKDNWRPGMPR